MSKRKRSTPFAVHPIVEYAQSVIRNMPQKTGKSMKEWLQVVDQSGLDNEKEIRNWLKQQHELGGTTATLIAQESVGSNEMTDPDRYLQAAENYVQQMYAGKKEKLRPIYDRIIALAQQLGDDVRISPCRTIVPLYREHVFAEIKPATQSRVDLGLSLRNCRRKMIARLIDTGGLAKKDRITHRFALESVDDIDRTVEQWLQIAYDLDA